MGKYLELLKNTGLFALSSMAAKVISFFFLPLYTYYLTTEEYAVVDLVNVMQSLLWPVISLSISEALLRFALDKNEDKEKVITNAFTIIVPGLLLFCIIFPFIHLGNAIDNYKVASIVYFIVTSLNSFLGVYSRAIDGVQLMAINSTISCFLIAILNVIFLTMLGMGVEGYFLALILGNAFSILSYIFVTKIWHYLKGFSKFDRKLCKSMLFFSIPLIPNAIFWWINSGLDKIYLTAMTTLAEVGVYSVAGRIPNLLSTVTSIFQQSWSISAIKEIDKDSTGTFFTNIFKTYSLAISLCALLLIVLTKPLAAFLFSNDFYEAWAIVPVLIWAFYYSALNVYYGSIFTANKKTKVIFYTTGLGALINIVFNYIMILMWGTIGAAIATAISNCCVWIIRALLVRKIIILKCSIRYEFMIQFLIVLAIINVETANNYAISIILLLVNLFIYRKFIGHSTMFIKGLIKKCKFQ